MRDLEVLSEPCFCHLRNQWRYRVGLGALSKNLGNLHATWRIQICYCIGSLQTLKISLGIVALFEEIYNCEPILNVVSNIG